MLPDNRLALLDQAFYMGHRATGQKDVMQVVWIYEHPVDLDAVQRFHHNFARGLIGRRIERSPLPFARYRWVADTGPSGVDIAEGTRPRAELSDWLDERSQLPVDPERGPAWHLGVLHLADGSTAISLVMSHYVLDGIGGLIEVIGAILGNTRDLGYPLPQSRSRLRALAQDAGETLRDAPGVARALIAAAKEARRRQHDVTRKQASRPAMPLGNEPDEAVIVPAVTIWVNLDDWNARAKSLGGTSNTLAAALTAKIAERMNRPRADDGSITVQLVVNDRTEGDTRAVAVKFARVRVDPTRVTTDLSQVRADIKQALKTLQESPDELSLLAPLTPLTPKRTWQQMIDWGIDDPEHPVLCSNLGDVGDVATRLDGTQCEYCYGRGTRQNVTRQWLERIGGQLQTLSLSAPALGKICIHVLAYEPGAENTKAALRQLAAGVLAEFDLTGEID